MRPWHHGVMSLRLIFSGALFFLRQWILLPATLGLLEAGAAQRVANTSLNMPLDLPDGSFEVVDAFPGLRFSNPVAMVSLPGNDSLLFVVEKPGRIRKVHLGPSPSMETFLDIRDRVRVGSEQGLLGLAFHPDFEKNGWFYLFYTASESGAPNRLSRFQVVSGDSMIGEPSSETIFINQRDDAGNHNGGDLHFGPDGFLYVALGDEGAANDSLNNSQKIDADFFAGILRIDVDQRPESLEPNPHPAVVGHYKIPADNPFVGLETFQGKRLQPQKIRTEFWAIGLRNPWRMSFDSITGDLYVGDVGQNRVEEVDVIRKGGNYGWNYREGTLSGPKASRAPQGWEDLPPILEYRHGSRSNQGNSITGGLVYRGSRYTSLYGAYVFADYVSGHIWAMRHNGQTHTRWWNLARDAGISAFGMDPTTEHILMTDHGSGRVLRLVEKPDAEAIALPATLSETGVFRELATLTPHEGIEPYEINVPFWSDHAQKKRWFSLPELTQKITPFSSSMWHFPSGAVWIKHFELELVRGDPSTLHRLETRLLVRNDAGIYGVTYRWNEAQDQAFLVASEGEDATFRIQDGDQWIDQTGRFPSRSDCLACHNQPAGRVLGFQPAQLDLETVRDGASVHQLDWLAQTGYLERGLESSPPATSAMAPMTQKNASLTHRIKSYLAANCASCHRPGGEALGAWDARYETPMLESGLIWGSLTRADGNLDQWVIQPGDLEHSELYQRLIRGDSGRMPPIGNHVADQQSIAQMGEWIMGLASWKSFDNWNETFFQGTPSALEHQLMDDDQDGWSNWQEFHLGTDPQWAMDHWRMSFKRGSEGSTLQFPNPGSGELSWNLEFDSKATSNASGTLMANSSEKKDEKGLLSVPVDFSKDAAGFFKMRIDWPEAPNADVEP